MWVIIGLGNLGEKYNQTRHNIGFQCVTYLAQRHGLDFRSRRTHAHVAEGQIQGQRVALAKPTTFMNLSGRAASELRTWYKIDPVESLLVIYDDIDIPFGKLRLRQKGSAGTHNGMKSIIAQLGHQDFPRIRVGVDKPPPNWDLSSYVLGRFSPQEAQEVPDICDRVADAVELILQEGFVTAMNRYN